MSLQVDTALQAFIDVYGEPKWQENPKTGQSRDQIIKVWEEELKDYTVSQVKEAAYKVIRYKKSMTFPTISHMMAMLVGEEKSEQIEQKASCKGSCPEIDLYEESGKPGVFGNFRWAFQKMVSDFIAFHPEADKLTFSTGLAQAMQNNGWWENKIKEYL